MDDDKLLRTLGALGAEEERDASQSKWERLLRGELTAEEVVALERLAEGDEEAAMLLSAHRPLDAKARERIVADLADRLATGGRSHAMERNDVRASSASSQWRSRAYALSAGLALAAGVALVATRMSAPVPLPLYALEVSGAASSRGPANAAERVSGACILHASARGSFELLARTDHPGAGTITAHAFLVRDGETQPWTGALEVAPSGSVRILDSGQRVLGASELRIVVGHPGLPPGEALIKARRGVASGPGWQVLGCAIKPSDD